jgi:ligand-binding sensor domain-containing protein/signal transduction histidine kinase
MLLRFDGVKFTEIRLTSSKTNVPVRITALCEDSGGVLWIGTQQNGLFRLDDNGRACERKGRELLDDNITSLAADTEGRVWIGTRSGLNRWDGRSFAAFKSKEGLADEYVTGLHVARSGAVWITTRSGMYQYKEGGILPYEFQTESQGRRPEFIGAYEDRRGNLWAFGDTYLINLAEGKRFNYFRGADAASVRIWSLCEGRDGRLWIGTSGRGLFCFGENRFQPVILSELHWPNDVRAICEDREENLWLGTSAGTLVQLKPRSVEVLKADQGLPAGAATSLALDANGRVYVALEAGGLFIGEEGRFERFGGSKGLDAQNLITSLGGAADETLWVATLGNGVHGLRQGRGVQLSTLNGLSDDFTLSVCTTPDGAVWMGTRSGTLHRWAQGSMTSFGSAQGLPGSGITVVVPARAGGLWLGTEDGEIVRQQDGKFTVMHEFTPFSGRSILTLHEDTRGRLWMGMSGAGLACQKGQRIVVWTMQEGLPDNVVYGVLEDFEGDVWLATASGISRLGRESIQAVPANSTALRCETMFESRRPFESVGNFGGPRALRSSVGQLWFATPEGLLTVYKTGGGKVKAASLPVHIDEIRVNGKELPWGSARLPAVTKAAARLQLADLHSLEFQFTALSFIAPEKLIFRHKLDGFDQDWVTDGTERRVRYGRLPDGAYQFRVAASQPGEAWHEASAPFAFSVPTLFWHTPAAIGLYILAAVGGVAGTVRLVSHRRLRRRLARLEQQQALERERMRIAQDMHDDIGSKLTKLSFLSELVKVESEKGRPVGEQIESIANTSRDLLQTLDEIVWAVNPRNDSLEHLAAYLSHYAVEYFQNTSVQCEMRLPRDIPHHPLSAEARHNLFLSFEEALNNVLKHSRASRVGVDMTIGPKAFEIAITDNGCGYETSTMAAELRALVGGRGGNGLVNMRQRLAVVGGQCLCQSERGGGATVRLRIPINGEPGQKL